MRIRLTLFWIWLGLCLNIVSENGLASDKVISESNEMEECRLALEEYSLAMGELQRCSVVSILPSNICQRCLLDYSEVIRKFKVLNELSFTPNVTCMQLYSETHRYLRMDSNMFTHAFQSATNESSAFARANCLQCYEDPMMDPKQQPKQEVLTYLELYEDAKTCFLDWQYIDYVNESLVCHECQEAFAKSQDYFEQYILGNSSVYTVFTSLCLDVADRYEELNQLYEGYNCKPNLNRRTSIALDIGGFTILVAIFIACYFPTVMYKFTERSLFWNGGAYVQPLLHGSASAPPPLPLEELDCGLPRATCNLTNEVSA